MERPGGLVAGKEVRGKVRYPTRRAQKKRGGKTEGTGKEEQGKMDLKK